MNSQFKLFFIKQNKGSWFLILNVGPKIRKILSLVFFNCVARYFLKINEGTHYRRRGSKNRFADPDSWYLKQAGTGPSRRHIQGSKIAKRLPSVRYSLFFYSTRKSKIFRKNFRKNFILKKNGPSGALKSHNAEKLKGGPFGIFQHPFWRKTAKKLKGDHMGKKFSKKSLAVPKKIKGGTLWSCPVFYVTRKNRKNLFGSVR